MNIADINKCIAMLEQGETTYSNCQKLASLLTVKNYFTQSPKESKMSDLEHAQKELADILPHYNKYCHLKADFQRNLIGKEPVLESLGIVCKEIKEYLQALYSSTDMPEERILLEELIKNFSFYR